MGNVAKSKKIPLTECANTVDFDAMNELQENNIGACPSDSPDASNHSTPDDVPHEVPETNIGANSPSNRSYASELSIPDDTINGEQENIQTTPSIRPDLPNHPISAGENNNNGFAFLI